MRPSRCRAQSIAGVFDRVWPEIEKEMCDRFILNNGFSFSDFRRQFKAHEPAKPKWLITKIVGTLLHATQPYDLSFYGRARRAACRTPPSLYPRALSRFRWRRATGGAWQGCASRSTF